MKYSVFYFAFFMGYLALHSFSAFLGESSDPVTLSLGSVSTSLPLGSRSIFSNPAWLCHHPGWGSAVSASNLYQIKGLYRGEASIQVPVGGFHIGGGLSYLSVDSLYGEGQFIAGTAYRINRFKLGFSGSMLYSAFAGRHGSDITASIDAGISVRIIRDLYLSGALRHIYAGELFGRPAAPRCFTFGFCYVLEETFKTGLEMELEKDYPVIIRFGQELFFFNCMYLRAGISTEPLVFSLGIGFTWKGMGADVAIQNHPDLGLTKSTGISFHK